MKTRTSSFAGSLDAPTDSPEYAEAVKVQAQGCLSSHTSDVAQLENWLAILRGEDRFKNLRRRDGTPFPSWRDFCEAKPPYGLGYSPTALDMMIREGKTPESRAEKPKDLLDDGPATEEEKSNLDLVKDNPGGNSAEYLTARIKKERPDILGRMKAGEFKSVRAAAIEAGIVKPDTPLTLLMRAWKRASLGERGKFLLWTEETLDTVKGK